MAKYLITGFKVLLMGIIVGIIAYIFNFILVLFASLITKGDGTIYNWFLALSNPFFVFIFIIILLVYLLGVTYLYGWLAQKLWKWK